MSLAWTREPLRFFQHLLRETDASTLRIDGLIDEIKSVGANACIVMGGGFSAWYPTDLSSQTINPHVRSDFLGDFLVAAKVDGIRTLVRMDISKGRAGMEDRHPDWFVRKPDGSVSSVWNMPQICATGPFWQQETFSILGEILSRYPSANGFFFNYLHVPRCYCDRCQDLVFRATGESVPAPDRRIPAYEAWRQDFLADYMGRVRSFIRACNPAAALVPYHHVHDGWNIRRMAAITDIIGSQVSNPVMPNPVDPQPIWNLWAAEEALTARALKPDHAPLLIQTTSEVFASRQSAMPDACLIHNLIQAAAHGAATAPAVNGMLNQEDARFVPALQTFGRYLQENARWYRDLKSPARVAIVRSEDSRLWGTDAGRPAGKAEANGHIGEFRGFCEIISDLRYPFDILVAPGLTVAELGRYDLVILPAVECLSDVDAATLDAYVAAGGKLLASADLGAADEAGHERQSAPLHCLPALPGNGRTAIGAYLALGRLEFRNALSGIPRVPAAGEFWTPFADGNSNDDLRLIGPFANNAPEFTMVEGAGKEPGLIERDFYKGHAIWLPWRIGSLYHRHSMPEYRKLLSVLIERHVGAAPVRTTAPLAVETILYAHPDGMVLHLINGASARTKRLTELTPLAGFDVAIETDCGFALSLHDDKELPVTRAGKMMILRIECLDHFAAIALTRGSAGRKCA
ncbi:alpha-amylase family protein [Neorhizobium vignae]|uniref:alpha-amylase family protein n=1 Tax=Neorhizobium vignae TaxID=690585 RepID=UPI000A029514|nr:alpha-amylase family protein [Neorhizobium vignae]